MSPSVVLEMGEVGTRPVYGHDGDLMFVELAVVLRLNGEDLRPQRIRVPPDRLADYGIHLDDDDDLGRVAECD